MIFFKNGQIFQSILKEKLKRGLKMNEFHRTICFVWSDVFCEFFLTWYEGKFSLFLLKGSLPSVKDESKNMFESAKNFNSTAIIIFVWLKSSLDETSPFNWPIRCTGMNHVIQRSLPSGQIRGISQINLLITLLNFE